MEFQDLCTVATSFSPFPHGTCSLSVKKITIGFEGGPPILRQGKLASSYFHEYKKITGLTPSKVEIILKNIISFHSL